MTAAEVSAGAQDSLDGAADEAANTAEINEDAGGVGLIDFGQDLLPQAPWSWVERLIASVSFGINCQLSVVNSQ